MTFPTSYTRAKDFTEQAGGATDHVAINNELDSVGGVANATLSELQKIQRSDSKLANNSVHKDTFDAGALALIASTWTPKGTWATATAYVVGDLVDHDPGGGTTPYVCTIDHTSGTFATDLAADRWTQVGSTPSSLTISPYGETLIDDAGAAEARTTLGASTIGANVFTAADASAIRTLLSLVAGTDVLAPDGDGSQLTNLPATAAPVGSLIQGFASTFTGYLALDGKTVGSAASAANNASDSYEALFKHLWDNVANTEAPVSGGRGASSQADWDANKTITLPDARGRYLLTEDDLGGTSAGRVTSAEADKPGGSLGAETKTIASSNMPSHSHANGTLAIGSAGAHTHDVKTDASDPYAAGAAAVQRVDPGGNGVFSNIAGAALSAGAHTHSISGSTASAGSGNPINILPPTLTIRTFIKF